ncbi:restriction endonuclease subunit S [Actinomycetaceae bacterium L2_0104]
MSGVGQSRDDSGVKMVKLGDVLQFASVPERISNPGEERFVTVKLNCGGAIERRIGSGKTPVPFTGYRVRAGQFIYSRIDARNGAFAILPDSLDGAVVSKDFPVFEIATSLIDARYLRHFFMSGRLQGVIRTRSRGATNRQRIKEDELLGFTIFLPSLSEQQRIAEILDRADKIRTKRRQQRAHLDTLTQSIFHDMFGDPAINQSNFPLVPIQSLATKLSDGPFGSNLKSSHYRPSGVPVIRLQNIGVGRFIEAESAFVAEDYYFTLGKHDCRPGDVLVGTLGEPNLRACIQPEWLPLALNKADCLQLRVDQGRAEPEYACWLLNMPGTLKLAHALMMGQTRSRISMGRLRELRVPLPPLELQREFAERVHWVSEQRAAVERALAADDELFASLQSRAFRGEL